MDRDSDRDSDRVLGVWVQGLGWIETGIETRIETCLLVCVGVRVQGLGWIVTRIETRLETRIETGTETGIVTRIETGPVNRDATITRASAPKGLGSRVKP